MLALNETIPHRLEIPVDDRPGYLSGTPYVLAVDTETKSGRWYDGPTGFLATASDYDRDYLWRPDDDWTQLRDAMLRADTIVMHNAAYDCHVLVSMGLFTMDELLDLNIEDTEQLARVILPKRDVPNYKLKTLGTIFIDEGARDSENEVLDCMVSLGLIRNRDQKKESPEDAYYQVWLAYPEVLEKYAMYDTRLTHDLYHVLKGKMSKANDKVYELIERPVMPVIIRMEHNGVATDQDKAAALHSEYTTLLADQMAALADMNGGEPVDPNSKKDLLPFLEKHGIVVDEYTESGEPRLDRNFLIRKAGDDSPLVNLVLDTRQSEKFLSTYIGAVVGRETVHPSFIQNGAWTGRMACMRPNMQNIPSRGGPEIRRMFVPRPDTAFVVVDYKAIEPRLLAYYMNDDSFMDLVVNGNPYEWLGEGIFGTTDRTKWPVPYVKLKSGFLAVCYGAGGPKLAQTIGNGMTKEEGRELARAIKDRLGPNFKRLNNLIQAKVRSRGYLYTLAKRTQAVDPKKAYVGLNSIMQGSAADIMKLGMVNVDRYVRPMGAKMVMQVHDELVVEAPLEKADAVLHFTSLGMIEAGATLEPSGKLVLDVEGTVCYRDYGEAKS